MASAQFGYSTTLLKYCQYSLSTFDITYIGWDYELPRVELHFVAVKYVSRNSNLLKRNMRLLKAFHKEIQKGYDLIFTTYFRGISLIKLLNPNSKFLIYVDTFGVMPDAKKRFLYDTLLKLEVSLFSYVAVISDGLGKRLSRSKYEVLPLGGATFNSESKSFEKLELLYVGTFDNRNMIDCVKGFHKFIERIGLKGNDIVFKIIGDGPNDELKEIKTYVKTYGLSNHIHVLGYLPQTELKPYFESANVGVSYIPLLSYYEHQTPTKTFEYLISGLPVIATGTYENKKIIKQWAGVIIEDNADSFCEGLSKLHQQKSEFCSDEIIKEYAGHTWENVVKSYFIPLLKRIIN